MQSKCTIKLKLIGFLLGQWKCSLDFMLKCCAYRNDDRKTKNRQPHRLSGGNFVVLSKVDIMIINLSFTVIQCHHHRDMRERMNFINQISN